MWLFKTKEEKMLEKQKKEDEKNRREELQKQHEEYKKEQLRKQQEEEMKFEQEIDDYLCSAMKNAFLLCPYPMRIYLTYYKLLLNSHKYLAEIQNDDIAKIFRHIVKEAKCPKTFSDIDKNYSSLKKKDIYFYYFNFLCNNGEAGIVYKREKYDLKDAVNDVHSIYSENEYDLNFFFMSMKDTNFVSEKIEKYRKQLIKDMERYGDKSKYKYNESLPYFFYQYRVLCDILDYCTDLLRVLVAPNYISAISKNEEFMQLVDNYIEMYDDEFTTGDITLYNIYLEYYSDVFGERLSNNDFNVVMYFYKNSLKLNNYITGAENIFTMMGIDYIGIVKRYATSTYTNIYSYAASLLTEPQFALLLNSDAYKDFITAFEMVLAYESIDFIQFNAWISTIWMMGAAEDKSEIYRMKNKLLNTDTIKIEKMQNLKNIYYSISSGEEFEAFLKQLYESMGYSVLLTPKTGDQGADLILEKDGIKLAVQAKHYSSSVGNRAIQEIVASLKFYNADKGIVATNSEFTKSAIALALANNVELMNGSDILNIINSIAFTK